MHSRQTGIVRVLRVCLVLAVTAALAWFYLRNVLFVRSAEAVINSEVISLRSPIEGEVHVTEGVSPGLVLEAGSGVFTVENPRFGNLENFTQLIGLQNALDIAGLEIGRASCRERV